MNDGLVPSRTLAWPPPRHTVSVFNGLVASVPLTLKATGVAGVWPTVVVGRERAWVWG
jgi:hypothetical protein